MRQFINIAAILNETVNLNLQEEDYKGQHEAPDPEGGCPMYNLTANGIYPADVYGFRGYEYSYGEDRASFEKCMAAMGRPYRTVTIYRAVPKELVRPKINVGDWVTIRRAYATEHGRSSLRNEFKIISKTISAKDIFTDGNSFDEWGYYPQPHISREQENEIRKSLGMKSFEELKAIRDARKAQENEQ